MSMAPNNPFESNQPGSSNGGPVQPKKTNTWLWVFGIIGGLGLLAVMVCCGVGYYGYSKGTQMVADEMKGQLAGNAVIEENIGEINSMSMNLSAVIEEAKKQQEAGNDGAPPSMVFDIEGSKGSGRILMKNEPGGQPNEVELVMADGSRHTIPLESPLFQAEPEEFDDMDIDLGEPAETLEPATVQ
ncbi:hypothetical protein [Planctomycetes bacterium K23_9]|uniref:Cytochrome oxidase complex assembly protein 1 n=1 Tax=Stieleria marina TaxID=1930275 RepID=A0A517P3D5_9BACT|nr:hypothetical protein K239x_59010 [Planctomycetes bacterium K23_9]